MGYTNFVFITRAEDRTITSHHRHIVMLFIWSHADNGSTNCQAVCQPLGEPHAIKEGVGRGYQSPGYPSIYSRFPPFSVPTFPLPCQFYSVFLVFFTPGTHLFPSRFPPLDSLPLPLSLLVPDPITPGLPPTLSTRLSNVKRPQKRKWL